MTFAIEVRGRRVLVLGADARRLATVTGLLEAGARVTVMGAQPSTALADLAERGLITIVATTGLDGWDLVIGVPEPEPADTHTDTDEPGTGEVVLVGGGPGDPGLITVAGLEAVRSADVVIVDRLAPLPVLSQVPAGATIIDVGKIPRGEYTPQETINRLLVEHGRAGRRVVRLKGGDSFVFGRGGEEWLACAEAGLAVRVIPGVSSATAAPALAGIPVTHRTLSLGFTVVTGHLPPERSGLDWAALAANRTTLVILMGVATLPAITAELLTHLPADTPAAVVADAGLASGRKVVADLAGIAAAADAAGITSPAVVVIGAVAGFPSTLPSGVAR